MVAAMAAHQQIILLTTEEYKDLFNGNVHAHIPKYIVTKGIIKASHLENVDIGMCNWSPLAFMIQDMLGFNPHLKIDKFGKGTISINYGNKYKF